jgi:hypothetical protein
MSMPECVAGNITDTRQLDGGRCRIRNQLAAAGGQGRDALEDVQLEVRLQID